VRLDATRSSEVTSDLIRSAGRSSRNIIAGSNEGEITMTMTLKRKVLPMLMSIALAVTTIMALPVSLVYADTSAVENPGGGGATII
jgi:hypothetical protein